MVLRRIALVVVVLIDNSDDLLRREVEDVRETRDVECRHLGRCYAVDSEVGLFVDKTVIVCGIDDNTQRNGLTIGIVATMCTSSDSSRTVDSLATAFLTDCIAFTAIIVSTSVFKFEWCDKGLISRAKTIIDRRRDGGTYGVWLSIKS